MSKREEDDIVWDDEDEDDAKMSGLTGEARCKSKFWKCVGSVIKEGGQYLQAPGGVTK